MGQKSDYLLEKLGEIFAFEMCTGYNGKVWIKAERPVDTMLIINSLLRIVTKIDEINFQGTNCYQNKQI